MEDSIHGAFTTKLQISQIILWREQFTNLSLVYWHVWPVIYCGTIRRTYKFCAGNKFLQTMGAPAGDARHGKKRRVEVLGDTQYTVHYAGVQIHVCTDGHCHVFPRH